MNNATTATSTNNILGSTPDALVACGALGVVVVPGEWVDFLTRYSDMFRTDHAGYWMLGVKIKGGWLALEHGDRRPSDEEVERALAAHYERHALPAGWFVVDKAFAVKAHLEGVKRWGVEWYEDGRTDAARYDIAVQLAALGEVRYG